MRSLNLVGQQFGKLTILEMLPGGKCLCNCACGTIRYTANRYTVKSGSTKSCGCLKSLAYHASHGESRRGEWTPEYRAWSNMITRCHNPNATRYQNWGGRGISVCPQWRESFQDFLAHVGRRPTAAHSIDRYPNNDGNYEPGNVRWATKSQQRFNQRPRAGTVAA